MIKSPDLRIHSTAKARKCRISHLERPSSWNRKLTFSLRNKAVQVPSQSSTVSRNLLTFTYYHRTRAPRRILSESLARLARPFDGLCYAFEYSVLDRTDVHFRSMGSPCVVSRNQIIFDLGMPFPALPLTRHIAMPASTPAFPLSL
jgi:hypothetical protein